VSTIYTIGYERLLPGALVAELEAAGVRRLLDVRYRPQSRRAGMSKTRLGELLAEHGIAYEHRRALGTPADIRWFYKHNRAAEGDAAPPTALMCLEADACVCHRRVITDELRARRGGLRVVDL
jgi:uncharacterized protein (DUF488 family)